jgi:predicted dienelactone hydrolase
MTRPLSRRDCLALGLSLCVASSARAAADDQTWHDDPRARAVPVRIRLPASAGRWPVVLYSHGLGGSREGADAWGEAWAAAGFVVVHLQHPGSDAEVLRQGLRSLRAAASADQLIARVGDVRFVLDEITRRQRAGDAPWRDVRLDAIGLAGHSFGAQTALAVAGQRFPLPGSLADTRVKAFVALSPSSHRSRRPVQEQFGAIARPFFAITGSLDGDPFGSFETGAPRAAVYDGLPPGQRALLWLDGADHMSFAGNAARRIDGRGPFRREPVAAEREPAHHAIVARSTALWWRAHLLGDDAARRALAQPEGLGPMDRLVLG